MKNVAETRVERTSEPPPSAKRKPLGPATVASRIVSAMQPLELLQWALRGRLEAEEREALEGPLVRSIEILGSVADDLQMESLRRIERGSCDDVDVLPEDRTPPRARRRLHDVECAAIGKDPGHTPEYRLRDARVPDLLAEMLGGGDELLANGVEDVADELRMAAGYVESGAHREEDEAFLVKALSTLERKLRVLSRVARMTNATMVSGGR